MTMIYKLRMLSDEDDSFLREYEVPGQYTLTQLHDFISKDLGFDSDSIVSFFASDDQWEKLVEFTLMDMGEGGPVPMDSACIADILALPQARLIYLFDIFNDRAMYIESAGAEEENNGTEYPRATISESDPPDQYEAGIVNPGGSVFDEAMDEFGGFEGNDYYEDEF